MRGPAAERDDTDQCGDVGRDEQRWCPASVHRAAAAYELAHERHADGVGDGDDGDPRQHLGPAGVAEREGEEEQGEQPDESHPALPEQRVADELLPVVRQRIHQLVGRDRELEGHPHRPPGHGEDLGVGRPVHVSGRHGRERR
jgi:hypothetical protein